MATIDEIFETMAVDDAGTTTNELLIIDPDTRQINIPGVELTFGVEADAASERKYFQCPRYVGNGLDLAASFLRVNFRNANGEMDSYLVDDVTVDGENVLFSWLLSEKVTAYKGQVKFVVCVVGPDQKVKWHTTMGVGISLEGLEPDSNVVTQGTADVVAQLITMVNAQIDAVESAGETWVSNVQAEGATQVQAVQTAAEAAEAASVAEIEAKGVNTRNSIPEDYTALSASVDALNRGRAPGIVCEVAGTAVAVNDAADMPMQGLRIFGRTTQNGTPTPENPVELVSVTEPVVTVRGKNLFEDYDVYSEIAPGVTYTISSGDFTISEGGRIDLGFYDGDKNLVGSSGVTFQKDFYYQDNLGTYRLARNFTKVGPIWFTITDPSVRYIMSPMVAFQDGNKFENVQIEVGSSATPYEPYSNGGSVSIPRTLPGIPVTSGGNYTDSEGQQWICDEVDLERGVYVQRINSVVYDGADESWALNQLGSFARFTAARNDIKNSSERTGFLCTHFTSEDITTDRVGLCFIGTSTPGQFYFYPSSDITTVDQWKEWLTKNPIAVYFVLATPNETALSENELAAYRALHSNYPNTTVLNSAGAHMVVKYVADTKLYIDNKIAALTSGA